MNPAQARQLIKGTFTHAFDKARFREFAINLLNHVDEQKAFARNSPYNAIRFLSVDVHCFAHFNESQKRKSNP